jgi:hypothetical protein
MAAEEAVAGPLSSETTSVGLDADSDAEGDRPATLIGTPAAPAPSSLQEGSAASIAGVPEVAAPAPPPPAPPPPGPPPPVPPPSVEQVSLRASNSRISEVLTSEPLVDKIAAAKNYEELAVALAVCNSWEYVRVLPRERVPARRP